MGETMPMSVEEFERLPGSPHARIMKAMDAYIEARGFGSQQFSLKTHTTTPTAYKQGHTQALREVLELIERETVSAADREQESVVPGTASFAPWCDADSLKTKIEAMIEG